jgi:tetratricopeptide (TPR) repeat protein
MRTQDYDRAAARFEKAIELDPTLFQPYFNRALCYLRSGNVTPEAARCIERAIELAPVKHYRFHFLAGQIWRVLERNSMSEQAQLRSTYHLEQALLLGAPGKNFMTEPGVGSKNDQSASDFYDANRIEDILWLHYCPPTVVGR